MSLNEVIMSKRNSYIKGIGVVLVFVLIGAGIAGSAVFVTKMLSKDVDLAANVDSVKDQAEKSIDALRKEIESAIKAMPDSTRIIKLERDSAELRSALIQMQKLTMPRRIKNPYNGHLYFTSRYAMGWHSARDMAKSFGAELVSIKDEDENQWLVDTFGGATQYWIGLTDEGSEGKWQWLDGGEFEFSKWLPGEPDNYKSNQHHVVINAKVPAKGQIVPGHWNDIPAEESRVAIFEISE
jgi:hypothetical protein